MHLVILNKKVTKQWSLTILYNLAGFEVGEMETFDVYGSDDPGGPNEGHQGTWQEVWLM